VSFENKSFVQFVQYLGAQGPKLLQTSMPKNLNVSVQQALKVVGLGCLIFSNATLSVADLKNTMCIHYVCTSIYILYIYISIYIYPYIKLSTSLAGPSWLFFSFLLLPVRFPWKQVSSAPMCVYIIIHIKTNINIYIYIYYVFMNYRTV
jgi:hypothetical protein